MDHRVITGCPHPSMSAWKSLVLLSLVCLHQVFAEVCKSDVCEYTFVIRHSRTMVYRADSGTYNVELKGDQLEVVDNAFNRAPDDVIGRVVEADDVITADGVVRDIIVINGQFPGPTIEVVEGCQVVVHVENRLLQAGVTLHWHGLHQWWTPWMDGAAYVTQYPIMPRQSFTYRFKATPAGTHWYHSHFTNQHSDGLNGMIIIHKKPPSLSYHLLSISDWFHRPSVTTEVSHSYSVDLEDRGAGDFLMKNIFRSFSVDGIELNALKYESALINGRGRTGNSKAPLTHFAVESGLNHMFRMVNSGAEFSFEVSIDNHTLRVTSLDGQPIEPLDTDFIIIHPGERIDFQITTNQRPGLYWIRGRSLRHDFAGTSLDNEHHEVNAILVYDQLPPADPQSKPKSCVPSSPYPCRVFNCPFMMYGSSVHKICIAVNDIFIQNNDEEFIQTYGLDDPDVEEYLLNIGYNWGSSINSRRFIEPSLPFYEKDFTSSITKCSDDLCDKPDAGCLCTNILDLPYNKTIQLVISNLQPSENKEYIYLGHHPMHLHGNNFAVVDMGFPWQNSSGHWVSPNTNVICEGPLCKNPQWTPGFVRDFNLDNPPIKDTILVPARGYVVLRFRSTNPGPWLFHCHSDSHLLEGMSMMVNVGDSVTPSPPGGFPSGGSFDWSQADFQRYVDNPRVYNDKDRPSRVCRQEEQKMVHLPRSEFVAIIFAMLVIGAGLVLVLVCIIRTVRRRAERAYTPATVTYSPPGSPHVTVSYKRPGSFYDYGTR